MIANIIFGIFIMNFNYYSQKKIEAPIKEYINATIENKNNLIKTFEDQNYLIKSIRKKLALIECYSSRFNRVSRLGPHYKDQITLTTDTYKKTPLENATQDTTYRFLSFINTNIKKLKGEVVETPEKPEVWEHERIYYSQETRN